MYVFVPYVVPTFKSRVLRRGDKLGVTNFSANFVTPFFCTDLKKSLDELDPIIRNFPMIGSYIRFKF